MSRVAVLSLEDPFSIDWEEFKRRCRVKHCSCGLIICVCEKIKGHALECRYLVSMLCPVAIACEHGLDVCPECDSCTCHLR
jgi:hypothetical protein